jgi:hypothetical protein
MNFTACHPIWSRSSFGDVMHHKRDVAVRPDGLSIFDSVLLDLGHINIDAEAGSGWNRN